MIEAIQIQNVASYGNIQHHRLRQPHHRLNRWINHQKSLRRRKDRQHPKRILGELFPTGIATGLLQQAFSSAV